MQILPFAAGAIKRSECTHCASESTALTPHQGVSIMGY
jgi:hypothetical protein